MQMSARNTVKFKLDPKHPPKLTVEQRDRLARVAAMPDSEIDYNDIPPQKGAVQWTRPGALVPSENKQQVTLRLDSDVLNFFRGTRLNYIQMIQPGHHVSIFGFLPMEFDA